MSFCKERSETSVWTSNRRQHDEESATSSSSSAPRHYFVESAETTIEDNSDISGEPSPASSNKNNDSTTTQKQDRRAVCSHCQRPAPAACVCAALPKPRLALSRCHCWILQHPHEPRRKNRSLPLVELCLENGGDDDSDNDNKSSLTVVRGRRLYSENAHVQRLLRDAATRSTDVWLLCPGNGAISLKEALEQRKKLATANGTGDDGKSKSLTLLFLDATWKYAKEMDRANTKHHVYPANLQRVQLTERDDLQPILRQKARRFDIRAPPSPCHLSTAECLAWVVACVEEDPALYDALMKPLDLMVHKWRSFSNAGKNGPTTKEGETDQQSEE